MENDYSITDSDNNDDPPPEEDLFLQILKKNLGKFYELDDLEDEDEPYIIADKREKRSGIIDILSEMGAHVIEETLDAGDYLVSSRCGIERKRGDDFYKSLFSGSNKTNLFDELMRLSDAVEIPMLIIEDFKRIFRRKPDERILSSLYGSMATIASSMNIPMVPTRNKDDTALFLYRIAKQQQQPSEERGIARRVPKRMTMKQRQAYFLEGLFNIGLKKSKMILDEFDSPLKFFTALLKTEIIYTKTGNPKGISGELKKIKGFGWKFVKNNKDLLLSTADEEEGNED